MSEVLGQNIEIASQQERERSTTAEDFRMVTFYLGRKAYGIDIMRVKEISNAKHFTYVPSTTNYVRGVFNLRGEIIPVVDMRLFFNLEITGERSELDITRNNEANEDLIILTFGYINIGIIVDNISHVVSIDRAMIQHSHPLFSELDVPYIDGIVNYKDQLYIVLAIDWIIDPYLEVGEASTFDLEAIFGRIAKRQRQNQAGKKQDREPSLVVLGENGSAQQKVAFQVVKEPAEVQQGQVTGNKAIAQAAANTMAQGEVLPQKPQIDMPERDVQSAPEPVAEVGANPQEKNLTGLISSQDVLAKALAQEGFIVTPLNVARVERKWREWRQNKNIAVPDSEVLESGCNRKEFIEMLESKHHNSYWPEELSRAIYRHFPDRNGNLNVWHAGCGNGQETYSIAAALISASPKANLQVRAADSELLEVAKAPLQSVGSPAELPEWLRKYLNEDRGRDGYTFAKELKDQIIFEYQDVIHSIPHTKADLIVIRDLLSKYSQMDQEYVLDTIGHSLRHDGLVVIGDSEDLAEERWELIEREPLKIYRKRVKGIGDES